MRIALIAALGLGLAGIGGCTTGGGPDRNMQVFVKGGGPFPAALAGAWQSDRDGWEFVIEPDGRISSAVISFGQVRVKPGQIATASALNGGKAIFEPGEWVVRYDPDTNDLTLKITMKHLHVETGRDILDGSSTDTFVGRVSISEGLWPVLWTTFSHYTDRSADNSSKEISTNPDTGEAKPLVFRKVKATP